MTTATSEARAENGREAGLDPATLAVIANRLENICREMTNTLLRAGRSAVLANARDFSCSIVNADNELLASAEGVPVHVFGAHLQAEAMTELHPDLREGDAYLDNDPYTGNTHHADYTILVPVFVGGEHMFTTVAKAHQADAGCSQPTTYMAFAKDVYEEGALNFPCVQVQRDYEDVADVIRMCRKRIRVPDQWYGDYLGTVGAARIGERRLKELVDKYDVETLREFMREWFDYTERRVVHAIQALGSGEVTGSGRHDPVGELEDGIPINVKVTIDADAGQVEVDLRDNIDCVPAGLNESKACSINNAMSGVLNCLDPDIPINGGLFRRLSVKLRENCVVGIPVHPTSCSVATSNVGDRLINITQVALAGLGDGLGASEGGVGVGAGVGVVSGYDWRIDGPYINQIILGSNGGPATAGCDGWLTWCVPCAAGLLYADSVELDELKYPLLFRRVAVEPDSGGPGRQRGAPGARVEYGPKRDPMTVAYILDGYETPPTGVHGGLPGRKAEVFKVGGEGGSEPLDPAGAVVIEPGEVIRGLHCGGGGYGDPLDRDPEAVAHDVLKRWVTPEAAREVYGVVLSGSESEGLTVDAEATNARREELRGAREA